MTNIATLLIVVIIAAVAVGYMFTFQVRYDEAVVLTTFDHARPPAYDEDGRLARLPDGSLADSGSVYLEPGLYFKWPWPIQRPYAFPAKLQILEAQPQQVSTADQKSVIVKTYMAWTIEDPYAFYIQLKNLAEANDRLRGILNTNLGSIVGSFSFDQMVNHDPARLQLKEIEEACREDIANRLAGMGENWGIRVHKVGIRRIMLPTTEQVFQSMRTARETMAETARSEGRSQADTMRREAEAAADRIRSFADSRAATIRSRGDAAAAQQLTVFREDEAFATFLFQLNAMREVLGHNTTFILDADDLNLRDMLQGRTPLLGPQTEQPSDQRPPATVIE